jgi:ribonuclease HI
MEIKAAIEAISDLFIKGSVVRVYSDSQYVVNGATTWVHNWAKHNWGVDRKSPIKNTDLWSELHEIIQSCACQFIWVKGHNGDEMNEAADALANAAAGIGADNNRFYRY